MSTDVAADELAPTQHDIDYDQLMELLKTPYARVQLERLTGDSACEKKTRCLADDAVGCGNLLRALQDGRGDTFVRAAVARECVVSSAQVELRSIHEV
jgi:hypothetical protein